MFDRLSILDDSAIGAEVVRMIRDGEWARAPWAKVMIEHIRHF
ncbi:MAG: hypothetical protein R3E54_18045 [Halioglobus sp.]